MSNTSSSPSTNCDGCYGAAHFDEFVFGEVNSLGTQVTAFFTGGATPLAFAPPDLVTILPLPQTTTFNPSFFSGVSITSPTVYFIISEYSITSTTLIRGTCVPVAGTPMTTGPFSYVAPASVIPLTGFIPPLTSLAQSFVLQLGLTCGISSSITTPKDASVQSSRTAAPGAEASTTTAPNSIFEVSTSSFAGEEGPPTLTPTGSTTSSRLNSGTRVGIGLGVPLGALIVAMFMLLLHRRGRKRVERVTTSEKPKKKRRRKWRAYFQDKGELDAEEQRRNELENSERRFELEPGGRHELAVEDKAQELKGDDHVQELR